jgi:hypothetical protein
MEFWKVSSQEFFDHFEPEADDWFVEEDTEVFTPESDSEE